MSKPKFNPNAEFKAVKPKFNPTAAFEDAPTPTIPSIGETALRSGVQGISLGTADELAGGVGALISAIKRGSIKGLLEDYAAERNAYRAKDREARAANPTTAILSELGGGLLLPGGALKGLGAGAAAMQAAGLGALQGYGSTESEMPGDQLADMATGTAWGLGGAGLGHAVSKLVPTAEGSMALARSQTLKHLRPTPKTADQLGEQKLNEIADTVLKMGAIKFGAKAGKTAERLDLLRKKVGEQIGEILSSSEAKANPSEIIDRIQHDVIDPLKRTGLSDDLVSGLEKQLKGFSKQNASGYKAGGRIPGTPTTITRKSSFVPKEAQTNFEQGLNKIGEEEIPRRFSDVQTQNVMEPHGLFSAPKETLVVTKAGTEKKPIMAYSTPESGAPYLTDKTSGLPIKKLTEKRIEGVPKSEVGVGLLEEAKRTLQDRINYLTDSNQKLEANKRFANILAKASEEAIDKESPELGKAFRIAKKDFGNLAAAEAMAGKTGALTNGGTGLAGTLYDVGFGQEALRQLMQGNVAGAGLIPAVRGLTKGRMSSSIAAPSFALAQALAKRGKTNEALKIIEQLVQESAPVLGRQQAPYERR